MDILWLGQDILPKEEGLTKKDFGQCAIRSDGILWIVLLHGMENVHDSTSSHSDMAGALRKMLRNSYLLQLSHYDPFDTTSSDCKGYISFQASVRDQADT